MGCEADVGEAPATGARVFIKHREPALSSIVDHKLYPTFAASKLVRITSLPAKADTESTCFYLDTR